MNKETFIDLLATHGLTVDQFFELREAYIALSEKDKDKRQLILASDAREHPVIAAIKQNNAIADDRPDIDFSNMKYDI